nr:ribonuclease H-like domain-containing protein [Tanacetum cinerariifolium]
MDSASPICLMARASSTKSWLWHQRLSHLNFDTINDLSKNDLVSGLPKFKYHKEHLCPSCEQGKSKRASYLPKPVPNSRSKDEAPEVIKSFLKRISILLQSPVIIIRTDNGTDFKNQTLKEYFDSVVISDQVSSVRTPQKNGVVECRNRTLVEAARTIYAPSTITTQQPTDGELDLLFEAMYDDFIGGQPSASQRNVLAAQAQQVRQTSMTSTSIADSTPTPTNLSSHATNFPNTSQDVDELNSQQQHAQQQGN